MRSMRKTRRNPSDDFYSDKETYYYIGRMITQVDGNPDVEVLSEFTSEIDGETYYGYARYFESQWSELNFESELDALIFLKQMKKNKVEDYSSTYGRNIKYIVSPDINTDLYLNYTPNVRGSEQEVVGGSDETVHLQYVATIFYGTKG